ncbi:MAG TPA: CBS domain-containing protein [Pilimelia sp.]|nr:CBS domain-containing protein [Pilimelia sp.]
MSRRKVRDVMTKKVVSVRQAAPFRDIVDVLTRAGISAVPVVDGDGRVLGVVSEADLLAKVEFADGTDEPRFFEGRRHRVTRQKATGTVAGELMSAPVVTIGADVSIVEAAKLLESAGVKRLPVVDDEGRLVGIVSRRDLLSVFLRPDTEIRTEIRTEILGKLLRIDPVQVHVTVADGHVTLTGELECKSLTSLAAHLVERVDGVVHVTNQIRYQRDDTANDSGLDRMLFVHRP